MDASSAPRREPLEVVAEEFALRRQRGESPSIAEYEARYPALAAQIRELFPALLALEDLGDESLGGGGTRTTDGGPAGGTMAAAPQLGDYRLNRVIGRGGMGVVYEAEQVSLGRLVAVKVLPREITIDPKRLRRFEREARAAARLHHTNIVPVLGVGHHEGTHFYIMQLIRGHGLDLVIEELKRLRPEAGVRDEAGRPGQAGDDLASTQSHAAIDLSAAARAVAIASAVRSMARGRFELAPTAAVGESASAGIEATAAGDDIRPREETDDLGPPASNAPRETRAGQGEEAGPLIASSDLSSLSDLHANYWDSVARIGIQVAEGLAYAHGQGIVHRDIKPSNLLLDLKGTVWITDFGLARSDDADDLSQPRDLVGTIRYMPPERFEGHVGDVRSDVYSLGLTLYELLALRPAYQGSNHRQLMRQMSEEDPTPLRKLDPTIPKALESIVAKATAREPGRRYATAAELAADLRRFLERRPIRARRSSVPERFALWCRRNPALAALTTLAAALTIAMAVISTGAAVRLKQQRDAERRTAMALRVERQKALDAGIAERTERERADRLLYTSNMRLAHQLYERQDGQARGIADLLAQLIPLHAGDRDLREFAWRLQWTRLHRAAATLMVPSPARYGTLTAEGHLLTLDDLGRWSRSDPKMGRILAERDFGRPWRPHCFAMAPGGTVVARGELLGMTLHLFDAETGRESRAIEGSVPLNNVEFSPDGRYVLSLWSDRMARVHEVATGLPIGSVRLREGPSQTLALTPDGRTVLVGNHPSGGDVTRYDVGTGTATTSRVTGNVLALACSRDGRRIAVGNFRGQVILLDTADLKPGATLQEHHSQITRLEFSADGHRLAGGAADGLIAVWDVAEGKPVVRLKGHLEGIGLLGFSPDAAALASADVDGRRKVWDLASSDGVVPLKGVSPWSAALAVTPDGRRLFTAGQGIQLWDLAERSLVRTFAVVGGGERAARDPPIFLTSVALSRVGAQLATGDSASRITVRDAATGRILRELEGVAADFYPPAPTEYPAATPAMRRGVVALAFSPDGTLLAAGFGRLYFYTGDYPQQIKVWNTRTGRLAATLEARNTVPMVRFTADGTTLIAACQDGSVGSWDIATWQPADGAWKAPGQIASAALSADDRLLAAGFYGGAIVLWERASGRPIGRVQAHSCPIAGVAFSPDGRTLATVAPIERILTLWEVPSLHELHRLQMSSERVYTLAFAPTGDRLITVGATGVLLWPALGLAEIDATLAAEGRLRSARAQSPPNAVPIPKSPPAIAAEQLDSYAGRYGRDPAFVLSVERQEANLVVTTPGGYRLPLQADSQGDFVHPASGVRFRFEADGSGHFRKLVVTQDGRSFDAQRLPPPVRP
jgi:serine/threonine protein kinase/WD40 repeat protein